jgi:hypothetical protein
MESMGAPGRKKYEDEIWVELGIASKKYEISNHGRVRSFCINKQKGRLLKPRIVNNFEMIDMRVAGKVKHFCVHKLTAEIFVPKDNDNQTVVTHLDWNLHNNFYKNLKWITLEESYKRSSEYNKERLKNSGKKIVTNSKLATGDVKMIKSMLQRGIRQNIIAKLFCVSEMQITRIKRNENWADIQLNDSPKVKS